jgi:hypothetical protein
MKLFVLIDSYSIEYETVTAEAVFITGYFLFTYFYLFIDQKL